MGADERHEHGASTEHFARVARWVSARLDALLFVDSQRADLAIVVSKSWHRATQANLTEVVSKRDLQSRKGLK